MNKKTLPVLIVCSAVGMLIASSAQAHYPWINADHYHAEAGDSLTFHIGWGHVFPDEDRLDGERIREATVFSADGHRSIVDTTSGDEFTIDSLPGDGPHMVTMTQARSPYSQTREGGQSGSRQTLDGVLSCSVSVNSAKALIGGGAILDQPVHQPLEIVPLADPSTLSAGDEFPIRVLLHDQPFEGEVVTNYGGYTDQEGDYVSAVQTDADGMASITLVHEGPWLFLATAEADYYDADICDVNTYRSLMTFYVN